MPARIDEMVAEANRTIHLAQRHTLIRQVQEAVAAVFGVSVADLVGPRRDQPLVSHRQSAMYLARVLTKRPLTEVGERFNRDHTTVVHAIKQTEFKLAGDPEFAALMQKVVDRIEARRAAYAAETETAA